MVGVVGVVRRRARFVVVGREGLIASERRARLEGLLQQALRLLKYLLVISTL